MAEASVAVLRVLEDLKDLCRAEPVVLRRWIDGGWREIRTCLLLLVVCSSIYGAKEASREKTQKTDP